MQFLVLLVKPRAGLDVAQMFGLGEVDRKSDTHPGALFRAGINNVHPDRLASGDFLGLYADQPAAVQGKNINHPATPLIHVCINLLRAIIH